MKNVSKKQRYSSLEVKFQNKDKKSSKSKSRVMLSVLNSTSRKVIIMIITTTKSNELSILMVQNYTVRGRCRSTDRKWIVNKTSVEHVASHADNQNFHPYYAYKDGK